MAKGVLFGVTVVDCSSLIPGPLCSMMLCDLGARVIRIESPKGDALRAFGGKEISPFFAVLNRGKKSVTLNLKDKKDQKRLDDLMKKTDVVITGTRPGKKKELGIDYRTLKKYNPRIVHCSITGYGAKGKQSAIAGHDINYLARSGLLLLLSRNGSFVPQVQISDVSAGALACSAIIGALFARERSGKGSSLDVSMTDAASYLFGMYLSHDSLLGREGLLTGKAPCYNAYETKDGKWVALGAVEGKFWKTWCAVANLTSLESEQWSPEENVHHQVRGAFKKKTAEEWSALNARHDFCLERIDNAKDAVERGVREGSWKRIKGVPFPLHSLGVSSFVSNTKEWPKDNALAHRQEK